MKKLISVILCISLFTALFSACSATEATPVKPEDFRITAYIIGDTVMSLTDGEAAHINEVTDVILFGKSNFDESGKVVLSEDFDEVYNKIKNIIGNNDSRLYINLLGPDSQSDSEDWYDQMADKAERHTAAFESGVLENNIKSILDKYNFDGVFFDYEYPIKNKYWKPYNEFIVSLDNVLGDKYKIGMALASWDLGQNKAAREATDLVEVMAYDEWDDNGNHATVDIAKDDIKKFVKAGYDKARLDLGVPFYARPTSQEAYWYSYKDYNTAIDENGLYKDAETGLTFSFNTYDVIKEKTDYALNEGLGGMMIWHWACDTEYNSADSLFNAMNTAKSEKLNK
ncbi:MAG: glycosyl hydrolase family 18 protein [Eubacterium sp.]